MLIAFHSVIVVGRYKWEAPKSSKMDPCKGHMLAKSGPTNQGLKHRPVANGQMLCSQGSRVLLQAVNLQAVGT